MPGHQSLRIELPETGTVILGGDVTNVRRSYDEEFCTSFKLEMDATVESIRAVKELVRNIDAELFLLHDTDDFDRLPEPPNALE
jgi:glyoxylase-like metal-dependent hydrolase (beta-lactamase superfamily II)